MENKEFAKQLENRTKDFAISIIRISISLPQTEEGKVLKNQLIKAGTSIGANYREANRARSKADFKNKMSLSESEASETAYWLEIIAKLEWVDDSKIDAILREANELLAIFTSVGASLRK